MGWFPSLPGLLVTLKRFEAGENPIQSAFDLFWTFCDSSLNREEFDNYLNAVSEELTRRGSPLFIDPEIEGIMESALRDTEGIVQGVIARLDALCEDKRVPYLEGHAEDLPALYVSAHLESARLVRLLNWHGLSNESKAALGLAAEMQSRCEKALGDYKSAPWPAIYSPSLKAIGSFLNATRFHIQKSEGEYEEALVSVAKSIEQFQETRILLLPHRGKWASTYEEVLLYTVIGRLQQSAPWMDSLDAQAVADCFEFVRSGGRIKDRRQFVSTCQRLLNFSTETPWLKPKQELGVWDALQSKMQQPFSFQPIDWNASWQTQRQIEELRDGEGKYWEPTLFWQRANWWAESQLDQSELQQWHMDREDQAAERRLAAYFFDDETWGALSERARSSLVNADRDWFSGANARSEALLNELKIAAEEILLHGLWEPLDQWIAGPGRKRNDRQAFLNLKADLAKKRLAPDLSHHERLCETTVAGAFLKHKGVTETERQWVVQQLPERLKKLRNARRRAEHETVNAWTRPQLKGFVDEFLGIGQLGIIPRLTKILFR